MTVFAIAPATAITPPMAATHGPHEAAWNVGGKAIASAEATAIAVPPRITRAAERAPRARNHHAAGTSSAAATAATIDHRRLGTHAPNMRSPAPVLVHGPTVARSASTAPTTADHEPATDRSDSGGVVIAGSSNSAARHSGPSTRPRTGTAQDMHTGPSQALHRATAALLGWWMHRSCAAASLPSPSVAG